MVTVTLNIFFLFNPYRVTDIIFMLTCTLFLKLVSQLFCHLSAEPKFSLPAVTTNGFFQQKLRALIKISSAFSFIIGSFSDFVFGVDNTPEQSAVSVPGPARTDFAFLSEESV